MNGRCLAQDFWERGRTARGNIVGGLQNVIHRRNAQQRRYPGSGSGLSIRYNTMEHGTNRTHATEAVSVGRGGSGPHCSDSSYPP